MSRSWLLIAFACILTAQEPKRLRVFLSDTHFGVGKTASGEWHPFEDARWSQEFGQMLAAINKAGAGNTDLILNGDTFELWQSLAANDCTVAMTPDAGCSEAEALARLRRVLSQHADEMRTLGAFAASGENRVVLVPGNHDSALLFDRVAAEVLNAIKAPSGRVTIEKRGYWLSPDGLVYAEHGHQIGQELNRYDKWPNPFGNVLGTMRLQRPWGEQFVQRFYNDFELKYPIIDNFSDDAIGVGYGLKVEPATEIAAAVRRIVRFYLFRLSSRQQARSLGGGAKSSVWDFSAIRAQGDRFLAESLPKDDPLRAAAERQGAGGSGLKDLTNAEIGELCELRKQLVADALRRKDTPPISECPTASLGAAMEKRFVSRNAVFSDHLDAVLAAVRQSKASDKPFTLFVYSHTHASDAGFIPAEGSNRSWRPLVVNTGAWQRTATPEQIAAIRQKRGLDDRQVLSLKPEDLPPCYAMVMVEPYSTTPRPLLRFWTQEAGSWSLQNRCAAP